MSAVVLRVVCAWCQDVLQEGTPGAATSHACCPRCQTQLLKGVA